MVTISRIRIKTGFLASIRGKILLAFFVIVGVSFLVAATNLNGVVRDYMTEQRTREDTGAAEQLAERAAPLFDAMAAESLQALLEENAKALDGRLMILDRDGKIQYDSMNQLCGRRTDIPEALQVIAGGKSSAYGMHTPGWETVRKMSGEGADYVAYCAQEITGKSGRIGVLLYVGRIQKMMDSLKTVQWRLYTIFMIIAAAALFLALFLSQILTKPITALSRTMRKMGKGDLSVRAQVRGSSEIRELAMNYNTMAEQLERLDKSRNQFVSNASHELKTPLATMKIMLETVMYQPDMPAEVRQDFMQDMNHEIDRLTGIITDLLTLTRVDNKGDFLHMETVNMSDLTGETVRMLMPAAEKKGQRLESQIDKGLFMKGDRAKLNQVLYNLIDNAMKYSPDDGTIRVSLKQEGNDLVWRVKDNGIGIPEEDQKQIFERFYRVDKARSRETGGTGLGLSIVRQMAMMHGGTVSVASEPGKGSEFTVRFPGKEEPV